MKRKVISFLFGLMLIFGVMGCNFAPEESFIGRWRSKESVTNNIIQIAENGEWAKGDFIWGWEVGKWVHNGDRTITLIRESGENYIAEYHHNKEFGKDDKGKTDFDNVIKDEEYLLVDNIKYYKDKYYKD